MSMKIIGLQAVQDALKKEMDKISSEYALIGIHESAGMVEDGTMTQAQLGALQHFGNNKIPARPWLDVGVAEGNLEYLDIIEEGIEKGLPVQQILKQVGEEAVAQVDRYFVDLRDPPNAKSTIAQKGSDNPLIDTGSLRQSITYTVTNKKPEFGL